MRHYSVLWMNPSGHAIQSELEIQYCHVLCPKPHGWNPAWHAQSRGTAANSPWTNPSHGFCPEAASSSPKGQNFSLHYTRRVLNMETSPKIRDTKQYLLDWHSSYSKSSVGRAALDPLLNGSFKFHSQSTERNNIPCGIIWHHRFHYWFNLYSWTCQLRYFFHFLVFKIHLLCKQGCGRQAALCLGF